MGERLAGGNVAVALLANTLATGAALVALILTFGAISGAHFNPVVSFADASQGGLTWRQATAYSVAQCRWRGHWRRRCRLHVRRAVFSAGRGTFARACRRRSANAWRRSACSRSSGDAPARRAAAVPFAVGAYITAAYWFTASTSFANPAVTIARSMTDTFAGIRPTDVPPFVAAQVLGGLLATALFGWLVPRERARQ